jgi:hypothetical protein
MIRSWLKKRDYSVAVRWKRSALIYFDQFALHHSASFKADRERLP